MEVVDIENTARTREYLQKAGMVILKQTTYHSEMSKNPQSCVINKSESNPRSQMNFL